MSASTKPKDSIASAVAFRVQLAKIAKEDGHASKAMSIQTCGDLRTAVSRRTGAAVRGRNGETVTIKRSCNNRFCPFCISRRTTKALPRIKRTIEMTFQHPPLVTMLSVPLEAGEPIFPIPLPSLLGRMFRALTSLLADPRLRALGPHGYAGIHIHPRRRQPGWNTHVHLLLDAEPSILPALHGLWAEHLGLLPEQVRPPTASTSVLPIDAAIRYMLRPIKRLSRFDRHLIREMLDQTSRLHLHRKFGFTHAQTRLIRASFPDRRWVVGRDLDGGPILARDVDWLSPRPAQPSAFRRRTMTSLEWAANLRRLHLV